MVSFKMSLLLNISLINHKLHQEKVQKIDMFEITGKVALVTGGASGIGLSILKALLENGIMGATIVDINEKNAESVLQDIRKKYGDNKAIFVKTDVSVRNQYDNAFKSTIDVFKNIDIVINCAGGCLGMEWEKEIAFNLTGTVTGTILAVDNYLPKYKTGNDAVVVNVASAAGLQPTESFPTYCAAKHGVIGLTRSMGTEFHYERSKVRVMAICPGYTNTPPTKHITAVTISDVYLELFKKQSINLIKQDVSHVSTTVIQMITEGNNGSIWVVEDGHTPYQIGFPPREQLKI